MKLRSIFTIVFCTSLLTHQWIFPLFDKNISKEAGTAGGFELENEEEEDGIREALEECDDGNALSGDGCAPDCTIETGFVC